MDQGVPRGFRDVMPLEALKRESIAATVREVFAKAGYLPVETPLLETRAVLERAGSLKGVPFQLFDIDDALLMLRPELTLPIARLVASRMDPFGSAIRLRYQAPVVREQARGRGAERQFTQMGVELIGGEEGASELEVMNLLGRTLQALDIRDWTLCVGSVRPLQALLASGIVSEATRLEVMECVHRSDLVGVSLALKRDHNGSKGLLAIPRVLSLHGDAEVLDELEDVLRLAGIDGASGGVEELRALVTGLEGPAKEALTFDFSLSGSFDYYTGVIFKAYAAGLAGSLASGGRYDAVLERLDVPAVGATGFALSLERLQEALSQRDQSETKDERRKVRVAVPKGSLFEGSLQTLEMAGLDVKELWDPGRHLLIRAGEVECLIVRSSDAPAFVAWGGADCGICGSDSLLEADLDLLIRYDLEFGECKFVVAAPRDRAEAVASAIERAEPLKVASKYPHIAQDYFAKRGLPAEVVELHGNIELAPLVGMADCIVDITATGTTLRENDLVIIDEIMECSARFFVSPAAYRSNERVRALVDSLGGKG